MKKSESQNPYSDNTSRFVHEATEHVATHVIGHAIAGPIGGFLAGLFHVGTLNENEDQLLADERRWSQHNLQQEKENSNDSTSPKP